MNTEEVFEMMKSDKEINKIFIGVYPIDLVPQDLPVPSIIVVNLDSSEKKGSHWIVLHYGIFRFIRKKARERNT